ncbi:GlxA family transcriptional regulator [Nonomuraea typhae]|uniref:GlxA family transcriptional regulator n=1 Tax=Nonomuraea typhae TaxID=2603600 RepID=A0ABW7YRD1_9ACTN
MSALSNIFADRSHVGLPSFTFAICAEEAGPLRTDIGLLMEGVHGVEAMNDADLIILLPTERRPLTLSKQAIRAITDAHGRGAIVAAYCSGTFMLAETGLLDGRRATTNWGLADSFTDRYPRTTVVPEALYVDEGAIVTGAGAVAGIDMCLHLLRREHGTAMSNAVAREAMITPRRESGQVHYIPTRAGAQAAHPADDARMTDVLNWTRTRLQEDLSVEDLARYALMSPRTFARRFRAATGTTPQVWLRGQRLDRAEELLETTDLPIRKIAQLVGFGSDNVLRDHFLRRHNVSPRDYRRAFTGEC